MTHSIRQLQPALRAAGTFEPARLYHTVWFTIILGLVFSSYAILLGTTSVWLQAVAIIIAAMMLMQLGLFAHEAGHGAVTRNLALRTLLGQVASSFFVGFSFTYWLTTHATHHNHPNQERHDPDMESIGYALYEGAARNANGLTRILGRFQPLSVLMGCLIWGFAVRLAGIQYIVRNRSRRTAPDAVCIGAHLLFWLGGPMLVLPWTTALLNYVLITVLSGVYMGAILIVPHVGAGVQHGDETLSFIERQVRFSRNYSDSWLGTVLCGGLNLQIEHHLLPYVPHIRLKRARGVVKEYCHRHQLPYRQQGYLQAWAEVLSHLARMSHIVNQQARAGSLPEEPAVQHAEPLRPALESFQELE